IRTIGICTWSNGHWCKATIRWIRTERLLSPHPR
uniref:Uncharacterized protein n=1 Tax=Amphimedon queenslandica TaxID=400682 RepID=A0A1X7SEF1_AMPQE